MTNNLSPPPHTLFLFYVFQFLNSSLSCFNLPAIYGVTFKQDFCSKNISIVSVFLCFFCTKSLFVTLWLCWNTHVDTKTTEKNFPLYYMRPLFPTRDSLVCNFCVLFLSRITQKHNKKFSLLQRKCMSGMDDVRIFHSLAHL